MICKTLNTLNIHYTQKSIMKSLPCNTKALTVKLPHRPTNWFNTDIRCANTCLLNCRHTNQVYKHYKSSRWVHRSSSTMERVRERVRRGGERGERGGGQGGGGRGGRGINRGGINRGRGRDGGHAGGRGRGRQEGAQRGPNLTNEIRATLVDHVVNHGLTLREAGLRV